ncbi:hypothetical protein HMPREF1514_0798 [Streptococcus sp. AS20]|nr:hypothetical protein HMPREF1514_0798 [Streptococcus sp. AS20]
MDKSASKMSSIISEVDFITTEIIEPSLSFFYYYLFHAQFFMKNKLQHLNHATNP